MNIFGTIKKFGFILSHHQKVRIIQLIAAMIAGGVLETYSISLILPFMNIMMNPEIEMKKGYHQFICGLLNIDSPKSYMLVWAVFLAFLFLLKNIYLMFEYNLQYKFAYNNMFAMQRCILEKFIHRPYEHFLSINSGEVIRIITVDTSNAFNLLGVVLSLCSELVVSSMLLIVIFMMSPLITTCIAVVLLILMLFLYKIIKPILHQEGINQQESNAGMNKWLLQSIQGIKELKVMGREEYFQDKFNKNGEKYVHSLRWVQTLSNLPRFTIEGVCLGTLFIVISLMIFSGVDLNDVIPILTVVAMAALRLLPSVNRISVALNSVAYGEPMLDKVIENLEEIDHSAGDHDVEEGKSIGEGIKSVEKTIKFKGVSYHYPDSDEWILNNVDLSVAKGECIGIVGSSGGGKTTTVDILLGLLHPQSGSILIDDRDISDDMEGWLSLVGYIPQSIFILDGTIRENVAFGVKNIDDGYVWRAIEKASLSEYVKDLPKKLDTEIGERGVRMSGGQRQRIGISRALYHDPEIIILDEATSALDKETENAIMDSIRELKGNKTLIIIAHRTSTLDICDHIYRVEKGKIIKNR